MPFRLRTRPRVAEEPVEQVAAVAQAEARRGRQPIAARAQGRRRLVQAEAPREPLEALLGSVGGEDRRRELGADVARHADAVAGGAARDAQPGRDPADPLEVDHQDIDRAAREHGFRLIGPAGVLARGHGEVEGVADPREPVEVALGNRSVPEYGQPVPVRATVMRLFDGAFTYRGGIMGGTTAQMGPSAWLRVGRACDVVVASRATYEYGDEQFQAAGFDPRTRRFVVAKNPMNFQQAYAGATAIGSVMLVAAFAILFVINLLQRWQQNQESRS